MIFVEVFFHLFESFFTALNINIFHDLSILVGSIVENLSILLCHIMEFRVLIKILSHEFFLNLIRFFNNIFLKSPRIRIFIFEVFIVWLSQIFRFEYHIIIWKKVDNFCLLDINTIDLFFILDFALHKFLCYFSSF
jgi:hypothetical protein